MSHPTYRWSNEQLRKQAGVLDGAESPRLVLREANFLNSYLHRWDRANIWIYGDRIVYVGERMPERAGEADIVDCRDTYVVPGYIEPHAHPFMEYNPLAFARYAAQRGTTAFVCDNLLFFLGLSPAHAFALLDDFRRTPYTLYWWCRFDAQTELTPRPAERFNTRDILEWLGHEAVLQGGELTSWPRLLEGDDDILSWMQEAKRLNKKIEGHFPGASEKTLAKLMLLGSDCDHEAMTGREAMERLRQGYRVSLRHSSIRPDLDVLLKELRELGVRRFDRFFVTTDGSHPYFLENGVTDLLIRKAMEHGVPDIDAYHLASHNVAVYYNLEHLHGSVATGRVANLNLLADPRDPTPVGVLAKGKWIKRDGRALDDGAAMDWARYGLTPLELPWTLTEEDVHFSDPLGIHLVNDVITKPYQSGLDLGRDDLPGGHDECFLLALAKDGTWSIQTVLKGFARDLGGLASSYAGPEEIVLIGKNKRDMRLAFERMKEIGGGTVLAEAGRIVHEVPLPLLGRMSDLELNDFIPLEKKMIRLLKERGYPFEDPAFTLFFLSATHLPFVRLTPSGIYDVKNRKVLVPSRKRRTGR